MAFRCVIIGDGPQRAHVETWLNDTRYKGRRIETSDATGTGQGVSQAHRHFRVCLA